MTSSRIPDSIRAFIHSELFYAVALPGAIGGLFSLIISYPLQSADYFSNLNNLVIGVPLSMVFGAVAGLATIVVLTNTDRTDLPRMLTFAFVAGFAWKIVIPRMLNEVTNTEVSGEIAMLSNVRDAQTLVKDASADLMARAKKVEPALQDVYLHVGDNDAVVDVLRAIQQRSGAQLDEYLRERSSSAQFEDVLVLLVQQNLVEFNDEGPLVLTPLGEQLLSSLPEGQQVAQNELLPRSALPDDPILLEIDRPVIGNFSTAADEWYRFVVPEDDDYVILTAGAGDMPTDTVVTLFAEDGTTVLGEDDDGSDAWPYSRLIEHLAAGTYILRVSSFHRTPGIYSLIVQSGPETAYSQNSETVPASSLAATDLMPGQSLQASLPENGRRHYRIEVGAGDEGFYQFSTTGAEGAVDTYLTLFRSVSLMEAQPEGPAAELGDQMLRLVEIGTDDDSGTPALYSSLTDTLSAGTYYIRVESFWGAAGDFEIRAQLLPEEQ